MKERTYGWYPSVKDIYTTNRSIYTPYQQECLYKFKDTMYHSKLIKPPSPNLVVRGISATPGRTPSTSPSKEELFLKKNRLKCSKSASIPKFRRIPTPLECWQANLSETAYAPTPPTHNPLEGQPPSRQASRISWPMPQSMRAATPVPQVQAISNFTVHPELEFGTPSSPSYAKRDRVMSATIHRDREGPPPRNTKSAGTVRPASSRHGRVAVSRSSVTPLHAGCYEAEAAAQGITGPDVPSRPATPFTNQQDGDPTALEDTPAERPSAPVNTEEVSDELLDYEGAREKYGWLAEVPGDPLGIKKLIKRLPYVVVLEPPIVEPEPPSVHMEYTGTFFSNTIPRKPATYTVHKEWISEVLQAKRMELQTKKGIKYRWKNFSFVY